MFRNLRLRLYRYFLKKNMEKRNHTHETCNYDKAKHIGILFDATDPKNINTVKGYLNDLKNRKKDVELLGFVESDKKMEKIPFNYITMKHVNWIFIPKKEAVKKFLGNSFDLLINLYTKECLPLEYLSAISSAKYRVGRYHEEKTLSYDLMVNLEGDKQDLDYFIKQVDHFINLIK